MIQVPCSHVGHIESNTLKTYRGHLKPMIERNMKRVVEANFGEYKDNFYMYRPDLKVSILITKTPVVEGRVSLNRRENDYPIMSSAVTIVTNKDIGLHPRFLKNCRPRHTLLVYNM